MTGRNRTEFSTAPMQVFKASSAGDTPGPGNYVESAARKSKSTCGEIGVCVRTRSSDTYYSERDPEEARRRTRQRPRTRARAHWLFESEAESGHARVSCTPPLSFSLATHSLRGESWPHSRPSASLSLVRDLAHEFYFRLYALFVRSLRFSLYARARARFGSMGGVSEKSARISRSSSQSVAPKFQSARASESGV